MTIPAITIWDKRQALAIDELSSNTYGVPTLQLMEEAGLAVARQVQLLADYRTIVILAGCGNNGGDALVAARYLHQWGYPVQVFRVSETQPIAMSPSCTHQWQLLKQMLPVQDWAPGAVAPFADTPVVIVDGLLGLGFRPPLKSGPILSCLREAAALGDRHVVAVDIPSGCDADDGDNPDIPLRADLTVTFGRSKPCHRMSPSRSACGKTIEASIGFPQEAVDAAFKQWPSTVAEVDAPRLIDPSPFAKNLSADAHKFDRGHVLVLGGSIGKIGAPVLTATAAYRGGAGWVTVSTPESPAPLPGLPIEATQEKFFDQVQCDEKILETFLLQRQVRSLVIGPGMTVSPMTMGFMAMLQGVQRQTNLFVILDAGALKGLAPFLEKYPMRPSRTLLTPHPGEWKNLRPQNALPTPQSADGRQALRALLARWGATLIYKTATPIVLGPDPDQPAFVLTQGSNLLAKAGSGDILAGLAAAHGGIGCHALMAAVRSQILIADTSNRLSSRGRGDNVLPSDILHHL